MMAAPGLLTTTTENTSVGPITRAALNRVLAERYLVRLRQLTPEILRAVQLSVDSMAPSVDNIILVHFIVSVLQGLTDRSGSATSEREPWGSGRVFHYPTVATDVEIVDDGNGALSLHSPTLELLRALSQTARCPDSINRRPSISVSLRLNERKIHPVDAEATSGRAPKLHPHPVNAIATYPSRRVSTRLLQPKQCPSYFNPTSVKATSTEPC